MPFALDELAAQPSSWVLLAGIALVLAGRFLLRSALALATTLLCLAILIGAAMLAVDVLQWEATTGWIVLGVAAVLGVVLGLWIARQAEITAFAILGAAVGGWLAVMAALLLRANDVQWLAAPFDYAVAVPVGATLGVGLMVWLRRWLLGAATVAMGTVLVMQALDWPWYGLPAIPILAAGLWWQNGGQRRGRRSAKTRYGDEPQDDEDD